MRLHRLHALAEPARQPPRPARRERLRADRGARLRQDRRGGRGRGDAGLARAAPRLRRQPAVQRAIVVDGSRRRCSARSSRSTSTACSRRARSGASTRSTSGASSSARCSRSGSSPELHRRRPSSTHDSSTNALIARYRAARRLGGLTMQLGMIGLGRMGANIVRRLMRDGHDCVVYDVRPRRRRSARAARAPSARPRSRSSSQTLDAAAGGLGDGPGGDHRPDRRPARRAAGRPATSSSTAATATTATTSTARKALAARGIDYVDVGTSGGVFGLERGYCLMIGGETERRASTSTRSSARSRPASRRRRAPRASTGEPVDRRAGLPALRPDRRRPLREDGPQRDRVRHDGRLRRGPERPAQGERRQAAEQQASAETTPLRDPRVLPVRHRRRRGHRGLAPRHRRRVVAARPDRATRCSRDPDLDEFAGRVSDSGEGRWTVQAAIDEGVPVPVLSSALFERFDSPRRGDVRRQAALGDAPGVRRPRRAAAADALRSGVFADRVSLLVEGDGQASDRPVARRENQAAGATTLGCPRVFGLDSVAVHGGSSE